MTSPLRIGIAGLGTVGVGVVEVLTTHAERLARRGGRAMMITAVSARSRKDRGVDLSNYRWFDDPVELAASEEVDVVVELMGGSEGPALATVLRALELGKHVVTANKALIALHGADLARRAEAANTTLAFEAAVAGGIPVVKGLREGLAANDLIEIHGILNGTSNYILTEMRRTGRSFADVLAEAQALGYAEADPSFDVDGVDAAHKLAILTSVGFGVPVDFASVHIEGIRGLEAVDFDYAEQLGYRIKLLGIARATERGVEQRVHPAMIPVDAPLAGVDGVFNAVVAEGDFAQRVTMVGRGAGRGPTASAVVADIVDIARSVAIPPFGVSTDKLVEVERTPIGERRGAYYVRLTVLDKPGVIADVSAAMRDESVSMEQMLQRGRSPGHGVPVVITTHETTEAAIRRALDRIAALETVVQPPRVVRIEAF